MRLYYHPPPTWASCFLFLISWAFIPQSMATANIVLVVIIDYESVCTYKSPFESSVMLQSSSCRVRELLRVLPRISPCRGWPCLGFSKMVNFLCSSAPCTIFGTLMMAQHLRACSSLATRLSKTWPLPITSSSVVETWIVQTLPCLLVGATIPSSPCIRICITV